MELKHYGVKGMKWGVRNDPYAGGYRPRGSTRISELSGTKAGVYSAYQLPVNPRPNSPKRIDQGGKLTKKQKIALGIAAAGIVVGAAGATYVAYKKGYIPNPKDMGKTTAKIGGGMVSDFQKRAQTGAFALENVPGVKQAMNLSTNAKRFKSYVAGKKAKVTGFINKTKKSADWIKKGVDVQKDLTEKAENIYEKYSPEVKKKATELYEEYSPAVKKKVSDVSYEINSGYHQAKNYYKTNKRSWTESSRKKWTKRISDVDSYTDDLLSRNNKKLAELGF